MRRFIEESFPVKEVSVESAKEKNIRHGHISTLHIWWARRPLASSRATNYAALIPAPEDIDEWNKKRQFIIELSKWENSLRQDLIDKTSSVQTGENLRRFLTHLAVVGQFHLRHCVLAVRSIEREIRAGQEEKLRMHLKKDS